MITITNKNIYRSEFSLSDYISLDKVKVIKDNEIVNYLSDSVELGESVTFKRLFDIISANHKDFYKIFYSCLGGYPLEPFFQEIENDTNDKIESDFLEIHWSCEKWVEDEFSMTPSFHGITPKDSYALDFVPLNNLKNKIVKINDKVIVYVYSKNGDLKKIDLGHKFFRVFDLFYTILFEITFHGGPSDKQDRLQELEDTMEEIESGDKDDYISFDDMVKRFEAEDIYLVKWRKLKEHIEPDRIRNESNLPKLKTCLKNKLKVHDAIIKSTDEDLSKYYKELTDIEFDMQNLYGEKEDISYHKFWLTPKCTCPKLDNLEIFPSKNPIFDKDCPIHRVELKG